MSSSEFVKSLIGEEKTVKVDAYVKKNENWKFSVARVLLTGILKNQYYRSADDAAKEALPLIIVAAKKDPEYLLKAASFAREANMKGMVKLAIASLAANASDDFLKCHKDVIISLLATFHPGQLLQFVELMKSKVLGRGFGSRSQKWVQAVMQSWSEQKVEDFTLKYPSAFKALLRTVHPNYKDKRGNLVSYLLDKDKVHANNGTAFGGKQKAVEKMKQLNNDTEIASLMLDHSVPWDVVKGFHPIKGKVGLAMMIQMGLSALLLNIRSLEQNGVLSTSEALEAFALKLNEVRNGRSLPIDFAKPYLFCSNQEVKNLLVKAMTDILEKDMPEIEGRTIGVSVDISGSMEGEALLTAGLLAVPFLKARNLWFTTFDTQLYEEGSKSMNGQYLCPKLKGLAKFTQVTNLLGLKTNGATDVAISINKAIKDNRKLDLHILITDEQQNAGTPLMTAWKTYKKNINPRAELWIINASNYPWHSADFEDPSVTVYQTMTSAIFKNLQFFGQDLTSAIESFDLTKRFNKNIENEE